MAAFESREARAQGPFGCVLQSLNVSPLLQRYPILVRAHDHSTVSFATAAPRLAAQERKVQCSNSTVLQVARSQHHDLLRAAKNSKGKLIAETSLREALCLHFKYRIMNPSAFAVLSMSAPSGMLSMFANSLSRGKNTRKKAVRLYGKGKRWIGSF